MTEAKSLREIAEQLAIKYGHCHQIIRHPYSTRSYIETIADETFVAEIESAILSYAAEREREVKRLTGVLGHVREHIGRDEDFDADELRRDIEGSVDLSEFDRLTQRAEKAETELARLSSHPATEGKGDD